MDIALCIHTYYSSVSTLNCKIDEKTNRVGRTVEKIDHGGGFAPKCSTNSSTIVRSNALDKGYDIDVAADIALKTLVSVVCSLVNVTISRLSCYNMASPGENKPVTYHRANMTGDVVG